ncbi:hypothetical protein KFE25_002995 [Diacronema lutheri]|uniref:Phosphoglycerate mutase n=2 Tax=Diacronema lutheri TaxID=2081491 RepID=A0A8J5XJC7_DIALT|nr:hypothetical protein KFE25_002995 [Diacronema lutheri]
MHTPLLMLATAATLPVTGPTGVRRLHITRHGETTWNAAERLQGTLDESTLTPLGERQAAELGRRLAAEEAGAIESVVCSPLGRARQTHAIVHAHYVAHGAAAPLPAPAVNTDLREIDLREWEGRLKHELATGADARAWRVWKQRPSDFAFADGFAPLRELMQRAERSWRALVAHPPPLPPPPARGADKPSDAAGDERARRGGATLVIAHGGLNRALLLTALGLPIERFSEPRFAFENCAWAEVEVRPGEGPDGVRWRWRHPGPAGEWRTARSEQEEAERQHRAGRPLAQRAEPPSATF